MANTATVEGKHPRGLYVLFFTEMWERFGFYLMIGIFYLYLTDTVSHGGRGLDTAPAISIVGTYVALIYLTPFLGGLIADRILGYTKSIFLGGCLLALGYFLIAMNGSDALMYSGLFSAIVGNGFDVWQLGAADSHNGLPDVLDAWGRNLVFCKILLDRFIEWRLRPVFSEQ